jgi:hypothetical protein
MIGRDRGKKRKLRKKRGAFAFLQKYRRLIMPVLTANIQLIGVQAFIQ